MIDKEKLNVIVSGSDGHMGGILCDIVNSSEDMNLLSEDVMNNPELLGDTEPGNLVVIDFSHKDKTEFLLNFCLSNNIPVVIATTGHDDHQKALIGEASKNIPVFFSYNMSMGVALLCDLVKKSVKTFPTADIEIVETHHTRKVDAPSGTAIMIAEAAKSVRPELHVETGRSGMKARETGDIGISSVRRGDVVGIHEVYISTGTQTITLKHEAHDRRLFAEGAIEAAKFLVKQDAGLYTMKDLIGGE